MKRGDILIRAIAAMAIVASASAIGCSANRSDRVSGPAKDDRSAGTSGGMVHTGSGARDAKTRTAATKDDRANPWKVDQEKTLPPSPLRGQRPAPTGCIPAGMVSSSMAFPTGDPRTSALVVEKGLPPQVVKGQEFDYIICVSNVTANDLDNVILSDALSRGFEIVSADPNYSNRSGGNYTWNLGTLSAGDSQVIRIKARGTAGDMIDACASVSYESAVCVATKIVEPSLQLAKSGPSEVLACDPITYRYRVTNSGTGAASNVVIVDDFPAGVATASGRSEVRIDVGTLAAGQTREFTVAAQASRTGRFENTATASAEPGLRASSETVVTTVRKPVLSLAVDCPDKRFFGRDAEVCATLTNTGDGVAKGATIEATIPAGASFKSATNNGRLAGNKVVWSVGDLAPKASRKVCYTLTTDTASSLRNYLVANAACAEQVTDDCTTAYEGIPAILVECIDLEDPDEVGTDETYVITVTNQGSAADTNIRLVCTIPDAMSYQSSQGPTEATARGQTVTFAPLPNLAPKAKATWRVIVRGEEPGNVRFRIRVTSDQFKDPPIEETESTTLYE